MDISSLPQTVLGLAAFVLLLGLRHGFDADHLATIDALTRISLSRHPRLARWSGVLFSLGHGAVVTGVALAVATLAEDWSLPAWLEASGAWISIAFLLALGLLNLASVLRTPAGLSVVSIGPRAWLVSRWRGAPHPLWFAGVGALFALSFDTLSQALLFALVSRSFGGWPAALLCSLLFTTGMLISDGLNGWWLSHLLRGADGRAPAAARVLGLGVAGISLLTAAIGIATRVSPAAANWTDGKELGLGAAVLALVFASDRLGRWLSTSPPLRLPIGRNFSSGANPKTG